MSQRLFAILLVMLTIAFASYLLVIGEVNSQSIKFIPDRLALTINHVKGFIPDSWKIYVLSIASILSPILLAVLPELEMRKKDDSSFTLITHLIVTLFGLVGISFITHGVACLVIHKSLPIKPVDSLFVPLTIFGFYAPIRIFFWRKPFIGDDTLNRGIEVIFDADRSARILAKKSKEIEAKGIALHNNVFIPINQETKHTLLIASPGSGKTQVIYPLIERIRSRGDALLIYDFKGDFTAAFGEDNGVLILSPFDSRGYGWKIAEDITTDLKALEFAASLIPDHESKEPFFKKAAQDLLAGVITRLIIEKGKKWTIIDLVEILSNKSEVVASCEKYRSAALSALGPVDEKQAAGVFGELRTGSIQLEYLARAWPQDHPCISLTGWVRNQNVRDKIPVIMLKGHQQYRKLDGFLTTLVCSILIKEALSLPDSYERRIWAILDEFGNLPKIDGIDALLTGVRSKGIRIVAALQDIAQIEETYSRYFAQTFFNCFGTVLAGYCSGATARYLSDAFGKNKIDRLQTSKSRKRGGKSVSGGVSISETEQVVIENALIDTDFSNLPPPSLVSPASFWIRISGWPIARLAFPVKPLPMIYDSHKEPEWFQTIGSSPQKEQTPCTLEANEKHQKNQKNDHKSEEIITTKNENNEIPELVRIYQPRRGSMFGSDGEAKNN